MRVSADVRLAIPVLASWIALCVVITIGEQNAEKTTQFAWTCALICAVVALMTLPKLPIVSLGSALAAALQVRLAFLSPTHIDVKPWDEEPVRYEGWLEWINQLRDSLAQSAKDLPGFGGELVPGLAIGETSQVSEVLDQAMKSASLSHLTAVSGANCAIVVGAVMYISGLFGLSLLSRIGLSAGVLVLFVLLVTPQPSVLRATVMAIIVLISSAIGRPGAGVPILASAALVMLLWDPWWSVDYGFILSVCATAGLLILSRPLLNALTRWIPESLAAIISIPVAAQLACQPILILLSPTISTYGVLANILAGFAAPLATVSGLISTVTLPIIPWVGQVFLWVTWLPAQWIATTAQVFSSLPQAQIPWVEGLAGAILAAAISGVIVYIAVSANNKYRRLMGIVLVCVITVTIATGFLKSAIKHASLPRDWVIAVCDVGQGDAIVVRSHDSIALIDTGRFPKSVDKCLETLHVSHINLLVLTHYDMDHIGGIDAIIGKVDIALVGKPENVMDEQSLEDLSASGAKVIRAKSGQQGKLGLATWQVLWPDVKRSDMQVGNAGSITLSVSTAEWSGLFLADLDQEAQRALMNHVSLSSYDVIKVAHHGSSDQEPSLYRKTKPVISLLSVGKNNGYGHPTEKTMSMLSQFSSSIPRTDKQGLILLSPHGDGLSVWTEH